MMRRLIDVVFALLILALTSPLLILIAILIKVDSSGPVFYTPRVIGRNSRPFRLFRFRTMKIALATDSLDQRLTRVGRFIRNYSLDHLPMLLNVLKDDLTIIGPRPMEREVVDLHDPTWQQYVQVKPGLFNYAVLKLGSEWNSARVTHPTLNHELEQEYRRQRTFISDIVLFWKFLQAFVTSRGNVKARGNPDRALEERWNRSIDLSKKEQ